MSEATKEKTAPAADKKQWIEITAKVGNYEIGQRIEKPEDAAAVFIEMGKAKKCDAPTVDPLEAGRKAIGDLIKETAVTTVKELFAQSTGGRKSNFRDQNDTGYELGTAQPMRLPAEVKRYGKLRNFKGADGELRAYRFGMYLLANYALNGKIQDPERQFNMMKMVAKCKTLGIDMGKAVPMDEADVTHIVGKDAGHQVQTKASSDNNNISSGFLVPDEFQNDLIDLRESFGVFRQNARIVPMSSDTRSDPRRRSGVTAYFVGEDQAGTQSTKNWDRVRLTAKKLMVLSKYSNELNEDAVLNLADDLAEEIAYAFAYTEDLCGFVGTGTSTYGGIVGATAALKNISTTGAYLDVLGLNVATGTGYTGGSYGAATLADFNKTIALLPQYANTKEAKWFVSMNVWGSVMQRLAMAAGGNRVAEIVDGVQQMRFAGYEVEIAQVMPKTAAGYQVMALFGNLRKAASLGDRRITTISLSDVALNSFEQDEMAIRGTERFDINVHDVGENANTTSPRDPVQGALAGPIVGLLTPNA